MSAVSKVEVGVLEVLRSGVVEVQIGLERLEILNSRSRELDERTCVLVVFESKEVCGSCRHLLTFESSRFVRPHPVVGGRTQARRSAVLGQLLGTAERSSQISRAMRLRSAGSAHTLSGCVNGGLGTSEGRGRCLQSRGAYRSQMTLSDGVFLGWTSSWSVPPASQVVQCPCYVEGVGVSMYSGSDDLYRSPV